MIASPFQDIDWINPYWSSIASYGRNAVTVELSGKVDRSNALLFRQLPEGDILLLERRDALFSNVSLAVIGIRVPARNFF
ncbi:hypothetical protein [Tropicimonas isoalkanivorans]|uniref:hypothetical protein n=1 Tax=Tropicimonas isoalkanivorans TaxID=441112 RepID=UPI0011608360|nr:hypothetical protein [Tropicimonas isoalkanivorans]